MNNKELIQDANRKITNYIVQLCNFYLESKNTTDTEKRKVIKDFKKNLKLERIRLTRDGGFPGFKNIKQLNEYITEFKNFVSKIDIENIDTSDEYYEFTKEKFLEFVGHFEKIKLDNNLEQVVDNLKGIVSEKYIKIQNNYRDNAVNRGFDHSYYNGGKRRRSTKRKTKRTKRKQKRNTKRRASHRRRR